MAWLKNSKTGGWFEIPDDQVYADVQKKQNENEASKRNAEEKYRDEVLKGNKVGIRDGQLTFKGQTVDKLDVSEAGKPGEDALADHLKNGELSAERLEVHRQILEDAFKGHRPYAPGEEKVAMFTGGGGASGKGAFSKDIEKFYSQNKNPLVVDPDEIKKSLAIADGHVDKDGKASLNSDLTRYYHEESSALAKQIYATSLAHNYPVMYDGTATGVKSTESKISLAEKNGYKTEMRFVYSDWKTVRQNALDRQLKSGRFVPPQAIVGAHSKAHNAVIALSGKFTNIKVYDNAGRNLRLVATGSKSKSLSVIDSVSWSRFSKSEKEFTLTASEIKRFMDDAKKIDERRKGK